MKRLLLFLSCCLLIVTGVAQEADWHLEVSSIVEKDDRPLGGATIELLQGGNVVKKSVSALNGYFSVEVPGNGQYVIKVSYPKCNAKTFQIDTRNVPQQVVERDNKRMDIRIEGVTMRKPLYSIDYSALKMPMAKIMYIPADLKFGDDEKHTEKILDELEKIREAEKALIEKHKNLCKSGDAALKKNDCPLAKSNYEKAVALIPEEPYDEYPKAQLLLTDKCIHEKENAVANKAAEDKAAAEAAAKAKADTEARIKAEAEAKAKAESEKSERLAAEKAEKEKAASELAAKKKTEEEAKLKAENEAKAKAAQDKIAAEKAAAAEKERLKREEEELKKKQELIAKQKTEEQLAQQKAAEELAAKNRESAEAKAKAESEAKARAENDKKELAAKVKAENDAKAKAEAELAAKAKADAARQSKAESERAARALAEKQAANKAIADKEKAEKDALRKKEEEEKKKAAAATVAKQPEKVKEEPKPKQVTETKPSPPVIAPKESSGSSSGVSSEGDNSEGNRKQGKSKYSIPTVLGGDMYKALITRADDYFRTRRYDEARTAYEEALQARPGDPHATKRIEEINRIKQSAK
jgi:hypothetical protein